LSRRAALFVTADTAGGFAGPDDRTAAHRLDHHAPLVQQLEIHERVGGHRDVGTPVGFDRRRADDPLVVEIVPGHAGRLLARAAVPGRAGPEAFLRRFHHAHVLDAARLDRFHARADVDVLDVVVAIVLAQVDPRRDHGRARARPQGHGIEAARLFHVQQHFVAERVQQVDPHLLAAAGHPRTQEDLVGQRIRVFVLGVHARERVVIALADQFDRVGRPSSQHRLASVQAQASVDDGQRPPRTIVAGGEVGQQQVRARNRPVVQHRAGRIRVVAPVDGVVGAVGAAAPHALRVAEIAVDVLPAIIDDPAVGQQRGVAFVQRAVTDLLHVGTVGFDRKQVAHDVPVAHAVFGLARGGEEDLAAGQIDGVDVAHAGAERQLHQARAVGVQLVDVVIVLPVAAQGDEDLAAVEVHVRVADHALRDLQERLDAGLAVGPQLDALQRPAPLEAARVDLPGLEHRLRVVVIGAILLAHDKEDWLADEDRAGAEGLAVRGLRPGRRRRGGFQGQADRNAENRPAKGPALSQRSHSHALGPQTTPPVRRQSQSQRDPVKRAALYQGGAGSSFRGRWPPARPPELSREPGQGPLTHLGAPLRHALSASQDRVTRISQSSRASLGGEPRAAWPPPETLVTEPCCSGPPLRGSSQWTVKVPGAALKSISVVPPLGR